MFDNAYLGDPKLLPTSILAYIGDSIFELNTRLYVINHEQGQIKGIHHKTIARVNAKAQAIAARSLLESLSEEELQIFKRGRNTHTRSMAKNADAADYQVATGLETLIGYLFLMKKEERLKDLLEQINNPTIEIKGE